MRKTKSLLISTPYILWMLAFTLIPLGVVGYYALTDPDTGAFTLSNLKDLGLYLPVLGSSALYALTAGAMFFFAMSIMVRASILIIFE